MLGVTALAVFAFFFLVLFLVVGSLIAGFVVARWWWLARKVARQRADTAIEGDYRVIRDERSQGVPRLGADAEDR
jgi:hypothetical protein